MSMWATASFLVKDLMRALGLWGLFFTFCKSFCIFRFLRDNARIYLFRFFLEGGTFLGHSSSHILRTVFVNRSGKLSGPAELYMSSQLMEANFAFILSQLAFKKSRLLKDDFVKSGWRWEIKWHGLLDKNISTNRWSDKSVSWTETWDIKLSALLTHKSSILLPLVGLSTILNNNSH